VRSRFFPPLILAALALLFFAGLVLHPTWVLYSDHSDLLAHYLPAKQFLVESWREAGELPLWCPYSLGGMPFIHDPQVGAFYPPHWLLLLLPVDMIGAAMSWLIVLHVMAADTKDLELALERIRATDGVTRTVTEVVLSTLFHR